MLSKKEEEFLTYWESARNRQRKTLYQLLVGLPVGLILGALILANFYGGWYLRAEMIANSRLNPFVLYLAVLLIAVFFALFSKKFQWDQQEQRYKELKFKKEKLKNADFANAANQESTESLNRKENETEHE